MKKAYKCLRLPYLLAREEMRFSGTSRGGPRRAARARSIRLFAAAAASFSFWGVADCSAALSLTWLCSCRGEHVSMMLFAGRSAGFGCREGWSFFGWCWWWWSGCSGGWGVYRVSDISGNEVASGGGVEGFFFLWKVCVMIDFVVF